MATQQPVRSAGNLKYLYKRGERYWVRRVIPAKFRHLAGKSEFKRSIGRCSQEMALQHYSAFVRETDDALSWLKLGKPLSQFQLKDPPIEELRQMAASYGMNYQSAADLRAQATPQEFEQRLKQFVALGGRNDASFDAIFGGIEDDMSIDDALAAYFREHRDKFAHLNERERAKKEYPVMLAAEDFKTFAGKGATIKTTTVALAKSYRQHLIDRVVIDGQSHSTVSRKLQNIRSIFAGAIEERGWPIANPFIGLSIRGGEAGQRPPFSDDFIRNELLTPGALEKLNRECRCLIWAMINTGAGPKELVGLDPSEIKPDADVPHIVIQPNAHRRLKTGSRKRTIPLTGVSLEAFKECPDGFPSYRRAGGAEAASATCAKYLKENRLSEGRATTLYSLRHSFKDRIRNNDLPFEFQNYVMGHKNPGMGAHYGSGYTLEAARDFLEKIKI